MRPYSNRSEHLPAARFARRVVRMLRAPRVLNVLSWLAWVAIVIAFALWNLLHYQVPARPAWVGLTIRTAVFAAWMLVARAWFALRLFST